MKLTRVTITGADDDVDPEALLDLSAEFPYVEWGVLRGGQDRLGTRRYPMPEWVSRLHAVAQVSRMRWSLHLCGELARHAMAGTPTVFAAIKSLLGDVTNKSVYMATAVLRRLARLFDSAEFRAAAHEWFRRAA